jgi:hypothetical protein
LPFAVWQFALGGVVVGAFCAFAVSFAFLFGAGAIRFYHENWLVMTCLRSFRTKISDFSEKSEKYIWLPAQ